MPRTSGGTYRMVGIPDGMGAFDNGDGTFTVLMNHELGVNSGIVRAHGSQGAFVSRWVIDKASLTVLSGDDLIQSVQLFDRATRTFVSATTAFGRLCSADLPDETAFFNAATGRGTTERIYLNGEEVGAEGRGFGTVVSSGVAYELPWLGRFSWENSVASPFAQDRTIVVGLDDSSPGQIYVYVGTKMTTGNPVEQAGLTNGRLFGVKVDNLPAESRAAPPAPGTRFSLFDLGDASTLTGAQLDSQSVANGVTNFLRPEDGAWDPNNPNDFYFVTTDQYDQVKDGVGTQVGRTRLYRLRFDDITRPELGGTIEAVLDGTEAGNMYDNIDMDRHGRILIQEDVGNQAHSSKIWSYEIATDRLVQVARHNSALFGDLTSPAVSPYNQDEESSGVIDVSHILGPGKFLIDVQAHYAINTANPRGFTNPDELVEGGQFLVLTVPPPATVDDVVVNDGSAQRSRVSSITVHFDGVITSIDAGAFQVLNQDGRPIGIQVGAIESAGANRSRVTLTFTGPAVVDGSLLNGNYRLVVDGSKIRDALGQQTAADDDGTIGSSAVEEFFRLFGDVDGNGRVGVAVIIDADSPTRVTYGGDLGALLSALNSRRGDAQYVDYLDFNDDGVIDFADLVNFRVDEVTTTIR